MKNYSPCNFEKSLIRDKKSDEKTSEVGLDGIDEFLVFGIGEINLTWIHLENSAIIRSIDILWSKVEMQMAEFVAVGSIVDLLGIEGTLHSTGSLSYIGHKVITLLVVEFVEVVDMVVVAYKATSAIGLLLEKEETGHTKMANLDHEIVQGLIVGAIETRFRIAVHS